MDRDAEPPEETQDIEPAPMATAQRASRVVLAAALGLLGLWILHRFLPALAWATILAIALWPLYRRAERAFPPRGHRILLPLAATLLVGLVLIVPLVYAAVEVARESGSLIRYITELRHSGLPTPAWLPRLPGGQAIVEWWQANLNDPQTMQELLGRIYTRIPTASAREIGVEIVHRMIIFGFTLLTLFFLFRDGLGLSRQLLRLSHRMLGPSGERVGGHMIAAVHGTVNGLVLGVGLAEGVLIGFAYAWAGLPHPVSFAALTGIVAVIPFGAPLAFLRRRRALSRLANGGTAGGRRSAVVRFGFRGGLRRRPFRAPGPDRRGGAAAVSVGAARDSRRVGDLWDIRGCFSGRRSCAALISLWRDWTSSGARVTQLAADGRSAAGSGFGGDRPWAAAAKRCPEARQQRPSGAQCPAASESALRVAGGASAGMLSLLRR